MHHIRWLRLSFLSFHLFVISLADKQSSSEKCLKFGGQFDVPLISNNVKLDCTLPNGKKVCCTAVNQKDSISTKGVGEDYADLMTSKQGASCCEFIH